MDDAVHNFFVTGVLVFWYSCADDRSTPTNENFSAFSMYHGELFHYLNISNFQFSVVVPRCQ